MKRRSYTKDDALLLLNQYISDREATDLETESIKEWRFLRNVIAGIEVEYWDLGVDFALTKVEPR